VGGYSNIFKDRFWFCHNICICYFIMKTEK
jgi:hypothetical protein